MVRICFNQLGESELLVSEDVPTAQLEIYYMLIKYKSYEEVFKCINIKMKYLLFALTKNKEL